MQKNVDTAPEYYLCQPITFIIPKIMRVFSSCFYKNTNEY